MPRTSKRNVTVQPTVNNGAGLTESSDETDFDAMPFAELKNAIFDRNSDPLLDRMLRFLINRMPSLAAEKIEEEKRGRSIVISGIKEASPDLRPSRPQKDLEEKVFEILDALDLECRPIEIRRMGRPEPDRARLVKVVFTSKQEWSRALANARLLRSAGCLRS
ncbi:hypothetical protein Y032_0001g480 [Ancylostoma ceylanicum]|uniref:Uncharacterized protein n=1 Tax=Ancylostoma ceylanicum TaxID=53326 RepID=A0A016W5Q3_9BILA|nr:hypothetical protein Y032_0001g480 [Ancylostoma ceylanicum]